MDTLKVKKAWEVALGPVKSLPMTFIMMYMSGNSLQIFSIMMVFMAFKTPITGLMNTNQAFERFQTETNAGQILQTKLVYIAMNLVALGVGLWKINGMGLLPYVLVTAMLMVCFANFWTQHDEIRLAYVGGTARTPRVRDTCAVTKIRGDCICKTNNYIISFDENQSQTPNNAMRWYLF